MGKNKTSTFAINFDLDTKKLKDVYVKMTGKKYNQAYYDIKSFMKINGFSHRQWSGYLSETTTEATVMLTIKRMSMLMPWLKDCVRRIDLTSVGEHFDLTNLLCSRSNNTLNPIFAINENVINKAKYEELEKRYTDLQKSTDELIETHKNTLAEAKQKSEVISLVNLVLSEHTELKEAFKKAKAETLERKAQKEKTVEISEKSKNEMGIVQEKKPKPHKPKL